MDALPVAVIYKVPFFIIMLNNGFLGLIRQAEKYMYEMEYEVEICYDCFQECNYEELPQMAEAGTVPPLEVRSREKSPISPKTRAEDLIL
jgi:tartronate-semialdehyde synthase